MTAQYQQSSGPYGPYNTNNTRNSRDYQSPYSNGETSPYNPPVQKAPPTQQEFLGRVSYIKGEINGLSSNISGIASIHQRAIWSPDDSSSSAALEAITTSTQVHITKIRDQIRSLENESIRAQYITIRESQLRTLKNQLKTRLEEYREAEIAYKQRYQEQIARQYKIINPDATEQELREASEADWGDEGIFETALKSNRTAAASSTLTAVRNRHNDIQHIEKTINEINELFLELSQAVELQEPHIHDMETQAEETFKNTEGANKQLNTGIKSAKRARRMRCWCFWLTILLILIIVGVVCIVLKTQGKI